MSRNFSEPRPLGALVITAVAALILGFAITYVWARQSVKSQAPAAILSLTPLDSDKEQDGLAGPVNHVRTETAKLYLKSGDLMEGPRELMESTTYDVKGRRVNNAYYLINGNPAPGRQEYQYDNQGHISEMTVRGSNNSIVRKEVYTYDYDALGNWTRMVTSEIVYEGGKLAQQPREVTYRNITYFVDQSSADQARPTSSLPDTQNLVAAQGNFAALRLALDQWIAATNARDMEKLMSFYDARVNTFYLTRNVSRQFVREEKARLFRRATVLEVRASAPEITINDSDQTATMFFRKQYVINGRAEDRRGEVLQELRWRRNGEQWKITGERDAQVIR